MRQKSREATLQGLVTMLKGKNQQEGKRQKHKARGSPVRGTVLGSSWVNHSPWEGKAAPGPQAPKDPRLLSPIAIFPEMGERKQ